MKNKKARFRTQPNDSSGRMSLGSPRHLARLFQGLVATAAPVVLLGIAGSACSWLGSGSSESYECSPRSFLTEQYRPCSEPTPYPAETGVAGQTNGAGEPTASAPPTQAPAVSCKEQCASVGVLADSAEECRKAGAGCCYLSGGDRGECGIVCMTEVQQNCGRRPSGLVRSRPTHKNPNTTPNARRPSSESVVGAYLAGAAELEAASVTAFEILAGELEAHGAPEHLLAAAQKSGRDERRHTRSMSALAKRFGGEFIPPRVRPQRARSLRAMALENAVEGCVREAFGALVATYQAAHAGNPSVRRAMRGIAADETSHAALAFRVAGWLEGRLDARAARSVRASMRKAGQALLREASAPVHPALIRELGVPRPEAALQMARGLLETLERGVVHLDLLP